MARTHTHYLCQGCGYQTPRWMGRCPDCGQWGGLLEERVAADRRGVARPGPSSRLEPPMPITAVDTRALHRVSCGLAEMDRVLGGGLVPGSLVLISGDPGIGK